VTDLDLFDDVPPEPEYRVQAGRYRFPPPPGVAPNPRGWMRASNLAGAFSDQRALQLWLEKRTLLGLLADDGVIFDELAAIPDGRLTDELIQEFAEKARTAAGAVGARHGTARHEMLQHYLETGEVAGHRRMRFQLEELIEVMEQHELDFVPGWSERAVWHSIAGGTMGRMDGRVLCRRTGQVGVIDLKTQRRFWTYQEICAQQWTYDSAEWAWEGPEGPGGRWVPYQKPELTKGKYVTPDRNSLIGRPGGMCEGKRVAIIAHMPSTGGPVELHEVDLEYGAQVAAVAAANTELRSRGKSVAKGRGVGGLRPMLSSAIVEA